jgi:hypothetical protein
VEAGGNAMKHKYADPGKGISRKTPKGYQKKAERQRQAHKLASLFEKNMLKEERAKLEKTP